MIPSITQLGTPGAVASPIVPAPVLRNNVGTIARPSGMSLYPSNYNGKLYHGTNYPFSPGDTITARRSSYGASSTPDYKFAEQYANSRGSTIPKDMKANGYSPRVFEVKPNGPISQPKVNGVPKFQGKEFTSTEGYTVVGEAKPQSRIGSFMENTFRYPKPNQVAADSLRAPTDGFSGTRRQKDGWY